MHTIITKKYFAQFENEVWLTLVECKLIKNEPFRNADIALALFPGSLLKKQRRREPGNIRGKSCRLQAPCSGGTNQIVEQNHDIFSIQQKTVNLISTDCNSKVGEKQFLGV